MKILYYTSADCIYGQIFWDENFNYINYVQENDAHFNNEYLSFIPKFFGGKMVYVTIINLPEIEDESPIEFFNKNKKIFEEATNKKKI